MVSRVWATGFGVAILAAHLTTHTQTAMAGPRSEIASAFDEGDEFDLHVSIDYALQISTGTIQRERVGAAGVGPNDPLPLLDDLSFTTIDHTITPRFELGLFTDLSLGFALPIVIRRTHELSLDGIAAGDSSTVQDGLLPSNGFDANDPATGFSNPNDSIIFRSPNRAGLDQAHLSLSWAPMNQDRDDTKPTWTMRAELRVPVGSEMKFDRMNPKDSTGVGRGLWEVQLSTTMAKRLSWAEPFVELWWRAPFKRTPDSQFADPGFGSRRTTGQQQAGTRFGFEAFIVNDETDHQRVSLEMSAVFKGNFEGRAYSQVWELLQYAGDARVGGSPLILDSDPTRPGVDAMSHPGTSNVENYLSLGGRLGILGELGEKVRFGAGVELSHDQGHILTFADAGVDKPTCRNSAVPPGCEVTQNDVVDPGSDEVNPLYSPTIDLVGHRYRLAGATNFLFLLDARVLF